MSEATGTRLYVDEYGNVPREKLAPGCYVWWPLDESWWVVAPNGAEGRLKSNHVVTEHEDGTITVTPSIVINTPGNAYHGFLTRGVWRDA